MYIPAPSPQKKKPKHESIVETFKVRSTNLPLWTPYFLVDILNWQIQTDDLAVDKQLPQRKEQNHYCCVLIHSQLKKNVWVQKDANIKSYLHAAVILQ